MVSTTLTSPVTGVRLSSVVPADVTGDENNGHEISNMGLALKLHYIRGVYFFKSEAVQGLAIHDLKTPMFPWLALYPTTSGRIRRSKSGRPFLKCNDSGVRIVEASCEKTVEEWLGTSSDHNSLDSYLVYDGVLGPDLGFSPLVFIQFTWFKCGGLSVGLSWAHILGDPFSASTFINAWAQLLQGHLPPKPLQVPGLRESEYPPPSSAKETISLKRVDPVGDHWLPTNPCKMDTHSFHVSADQLDNIIPDADTLSRQATMASNFAILSAIIWRSLSRIRENSGPNIVTICSSGPSTIVSRTNEAPSNSMVFSIVRADFPVAEGDVHKLAALIAEKQELENGLIDEMVRGDDGGSSDYIVYGANLTFVDLEEADIYGMEIKGQKPIFANYTVKGVGEEGAVLVLPGPDHGRTVTVILPEDQLVGLKEELKKYWGIV